MKPTSEMLHRLNRAVSSPRLKYAAILAADIMRLRHLIVRLDAVNACQLRCGMCFFSDPGWRKAHMKGQFTKQDIEHLAEMFFAEALQVHIGCGMEPTMFQDYPWLVELAKRYRVPFVGFTTNAQKLDAAAFERMAKAGLDEITLSTHGVDRETYERLMVGANYDRLFAALEMIDDVRTKIGNGPRVRLNYTVCPDNLTELSRFFDVYGRYRITTIQLRPVADFGDTTYREKDMTPHLDRYNEMIEGMIAACRSRNINLLANRIDPTHTHPNAAADIYNVGILRYLNPSIVWREDFEWRSTHYRTHKRRIGWRRQLFGRVMAGDMGNAPTSHQAIFDVF